MKKICLTLILTMFFITKSEAVCHVADITHFDMSVKDIVVQRDISIGTVIGTFNSPTDASRQYLSCDNTAGNIYYEMEYNSGIPAGIDHVYKTNVEGVGISLTQDSGWNFDNPATIRQKSTAAGLYVSKPYIMNIVKTGPIVSGTLNSGTIGNVHGDDNVHAAIFNLPPGMKVTALACELTTPTLTFPLGSVPISDFGKTVGFNPSHTSTQNLGLNCDADANINVMLNGTQNSDVSDNSVLALNNSGDTGTATGVGVQLLYGNVPLKINEKIVMKRSIGGQELLPITARYYQTKTQVMPGDASTSATLTLTYQ